MSQNNLPKPSVHRALLSVSDKTGIVEFAQGLVNLGVKILSTGGTAKLLKEHHIAVTLVSDVTQFPEIMQGRVKTLHPKIHGGILGKRDQHSSDAKQHDITWIDLVVCNLYPFAQTIQNNPSLDLALENIDIGGPCMIRAAAKNIDWVTAVCDPADYLDILQKLQHDALDFATRKKFAAKAFTHTASYDNMIAQYLTDAQPFAQHMMLSLDKVDSLRYGENPHQSAAVYRRTGSKSPLLDASLLQGKPMSFNNYADAQAALNCLHAFENPACVVVKHMNPCGAATSKTIEAAFNKAWAGNAVAAFGGIVALNRALSVEIAEFLASVFVEVIIAPAIEPQAQTILQQKPNCRILIYDPDLCTSHGYMVKDLQGGMLLQDYDTDKLTQSDCQVVTHTQPTPQQWQDLLFAWAVIKHVKSNAILLAQDNQAIGIGTGQVSRIDAVNIAICQAAERLTHNTVLASEAFFPFRDSIDQIAQTPIKAIIQPGGSIRDREVIAACDESSMVMVFTGRRCFCH